MPWARLELDESDAGVLVAADADRLQQVIVNLLSNAIKFSPPDGRVALRWWKQSEQAVLEISDEGPGIPSDQLETVFDKFRQLEQTATRKYGGAGLGLAISRTIVEQFGGDLWAESDEGEGARFFVRLRLAHEAPIVEERLPAEVTGVKRVILAERNPDLQRLLSTQFEEDDWEVFVTARGGEALEEAKRESVGVVVAAVELDDMHGLEFLQRLRSVATSVDIPALLFGPGSDASQAVAYGADGWTVGDADGLVKEANRLVTAHRRPIVLLIEDDPAVRTGLARGLRRAGYACLEAASGEVGMNLARERAPDLVVTDFQIPGKDGLMVLREFRADPLLSDVPAIVVTGHPASETKEAIESLQAAFVSKPFGAATILKEVERLIGAPPAAS
jgi:DNA-binding response OmpR family regulator